LGCSRARSPSEAASCRPSASAWYTHAWLYSLASQWGAAGQNENTNTALAMTVPAPQAAFYVYPDFTPLAGLLLRRHGITSDQDLADLLLTKYGVGVLPGSAFGEASKRLRLRVATGMLYGETDAERNAALNDADPCSLPWIAAALDRLEEVLTDLTR